MQSNNLINYWRLACVLAVLSGSGLEVIGSSVYTAFAFTNFAGMPGLVGTNDGIGTAARFNAVAGVATDNAGNVYVADWANTIRKITPLGLVSTLAGSAGKPGTNDGAGGVARFNAPCGLAVDPVGNCYVADSGNHAVRKITPGGLVITLAGKAGQAGNADGAGSNAQFSNPHGIAVDTAGTVYVADTDNCTIRVVTSDGAVTTLAGRAGQYGSMDGSGTNALFSSPEGVAVDSAGNLYVADSANNLVRKVTSGAVVTTLAGDPSTYGFSDGIGTQAQFFWPQGIAVDSAGNVYVAEETADKIRRIGRGGTVTSLAGSPSLEGHTDGIGSQALFYGPVGVAVDGLGNLYVADANNQRITKGTQTFLEFRANPGSLAVSNGFCQAHLTGPLSNNVIIDASTDLRSWTPVQTNGLPPGGLSFSVRLGSGPTLYLRSRLK